MADPLQAEIERALQLEKAQAAVVAAVALTATLTTSSNKDINTSGVYRILV